MRVGRSNGHTSARLTSGSSGTGRFSERLSSADSARREPSLISPARRSYSSASIKSPPSSLDGCLVPWRWEWCWLRRSMAACHTACPFGLCCVTQTWFNWPPEYFCCSPCSPALAACLAFSWASSFTFRLRASCFRNVKEDAHENARQAAKAGEHGEQQKYSGGQLNQVCVTQHKPNGHAV